jgi:hypothetical protein
VSRVPFQVDRITFRPIVLQDIDGSHDDITSNNCVGRGDSGDDVTGHLYQTHQI